MTADSRINEPETSLWQRAPLLLFLFLTAVFFVTSHDMFRNQFAAFRGVEEFNPTEEEALVLLAQYESGQWYKAATYLLLGGVSFLGMLAFSSVRPLAARGFYGRVVVFFFLWCVLSAAWSFEPAITANKLAIFVMLSLGALFVAQRFRIQDLLYFVILSSTLYLIAGVGSEVFWGSFRPWVSGYRFSGTIHPNGQGMNCALMFLACVFAAARPGEWRRQFLMLAVVALTFLVLTKSRTPFALVFISLALYSLLWLPAALKILLVAGAALLACATPIFYPVLGPFIESVVQMGRTETTLSHATQLTGRTELWNECWYFIQQRPLLGWGYNSFWTAENTQDIAMQIDWYSGSAHSIYLDLWLGLGVFGMIAYIILLVGGLAYFGSKSMNTNEPAYAFAFVLLLFSIMHGAFESAFLFPALYTFLVMVLLARCGFVEETDAESEIEPMAASERTLAAAR